MEEKVWREIWAIVRAFLLPGMRTQPILHFVRGQVYRIILSRLYYVAHHVGRLLLRNVGLALEQWRGDVHRRVLGELKSRFVDMGTMRLNAWEALRILRRLRSQADYELDTHIRNGDITQAVTLFETYLDECCPNNAEIFVN